MDKITQARRSLNMGRIRSVDTGPELRVRRLLYSLGYRYKIHDPLLPGRPDIVFPARKKAILVHGCFWHQHADTKCQYAHSPQSGRAYWIPKLNKNVKRDKENLVKLKQRGWDTLVIWECELERPLDVTGTLIEFLGAPKMADER